MARVKTNEQVDEFCLLYRDINVQYDIYAKSVGMSYDSALVLCMIYGHEEGCTQKDLRDETFLSKQTINTIITSFWKQGLIKLTELESDRRMKMVSFTEKGLEYAEKIVPKIKIAENMAMDSLTESEQASLIEATRLYVARFREFLNKSDG
jgi:DNA-binding MarR family transcriptional regulator